MERWIPMTRRRTLFTPGSRTRITLKTHREKVWKGARKGVAIRLRILTQDRLFDQTGDNVIEWYAIVDRRRKYTGLATTVAEALDQIEEKAAL